MATELRKYTHQHQLQPIDDVPFLVSAGGSQPRKTVNTTQSYVTMFTAYVVTVKLMRKVKARHKDSLRAASASGKWSWRTATAALSAYSLTWIAPPWVDNRATLLSCCHHMIYEQACRTPWQPLLAHSAASVKVRVLSLLHACFALLFHWKWCPSGVVRMSSFWVYEEAEGLWNTRHSDYNNQTR